MVASARIAYLARRAADYGIRCGPVSVDLAQVHRRKQAIVDDFRAGEQRRLEDAENVELIFGEARFTGPKVVEVRLTAGGTRTLTADSIFINTGARPARPRIAGLNSVRALDSTSIMELQELPEHLLVLGGGYVGLEFGQMFRRFGSAVTVVQHGKQLLGREDPDVAAEVCKLLQADGIEILLETEAVGVHASASGVGLDLRGPTGERTVTGSHLLLATGRVPNSEQLNLAAAGVNVDARGFIPVNDRLETNVAGIYALGDVKGGPAFTHISYDDYRIIRNNLASWRAIVDEGPTGSVHRLHRSTARADRSDGAGGAGTGPRDPRRQDPDVLGRPRSGNGRITRLHQGRRRCRDRADSWGRRPGRRRRRDHVDASDRHDGQASLHRARRRHLRAPGLCGGIEHVVHEHGEMSLRS